MESVLNVISGILLLIPSVPPGIISVSSSPIPGTN